MRILKRKAMVKATVIMLAVAVVAFATVYLISPSYFFTLGDKKAVPPRRSILLQTG